MPNALQTSNLNYSFGNFTATANVNLSIAAGARHALIGPNGAGKTTLINLLTGFLTADAGTISLFDQDISRMAQHQRTRLGLVRTFQINQLFKQMTVLESISMAVAESQGLGLSWFKPLASYSQISAQAAVIMDMLGILPLAFKLTADLAYGQQRLLEIALALALEPRVLLLDEPAAGVAPHESHMIFEKIFQLPRTVTVLLIEHDMNLVFNFAEQISVLVAGNLILNGAPELIANHHQVKEVYLGTSHD